MGGIQERSESKSWGLNGREASIYGRFLPRFEPDYLYALDNNYENGDAEVRNAQRRRRISC
jgi:hypothetical protein